MAFLYIAFEKGESIKPIEGVHLLTAYGASVSFEAVKFKDSKAVETKLTEDGWIVRTSTVPGVWFLADHFILA